MLNRKIIPVLMHGDAAFAGQGVVAETLNMSLVRRAIKPVERFISSLTTK
jgi:hypothetical protein